MNFIPNKGDMFYVTYIPRDRIIDGGPFGTATVVKQMDNSYCDDIFECLASDETVIVGKFLTENYFQNKPITFRRSKVTFSPVGPDVVAALGLKNKITEKE